MKNKYPSITLLKVRLAMQDHEESAERKMVLRLLSKKHKYIKWFNILFNNGEIVGVEYVARDKGDRCYNNHKAELRQTEGRIELLEVVNT